jgi:hypothetical protein
MKEVQVKMLEEKIVAEKVISKQRVYLNQIRERKEMILLRRATLMIKNSLKIS